MMMHYFATSNNQLHVFTQIVHSNISNMGSVLSAAFEYTFDLFHSP